MWKSGFWKIFILIVVCNLVFVAIVDKKFDQVDIVDFVDGFIDMMLKV